MDYNKANLQNYLCNRRVKIATGYPANEVELREKRSGYLRWFVAFKEFFQYLGHSDYEVVVPPEKGWETIYPNGTWGGVIGMVKNGEADIGLCATMTDKRLSVVDFAPPLDITKVVILTKEPVAYTNNTYFLSVYSPIVFLLIFITLLVVTVLSILFDNIPINKNEPRPNLLYLIGNTLWRSLRMFFGDTHTMRSRLRSVNVLILTWLLALQVFVSVYENFISAQFTIPKKEKPIDSGEDLLNAVGKGKMTWGTYTNTAFETTLETATEGILQKLWQVSDNKFKSGLLTIIDNYETYERVLKQNYAIAGPEGPLVMAYYNRTGQYHISTSGFLQMLDTFVISKGSVFKKVINFYVQSAIEFGFFAKWKKEIEMIARRFEDPNEIISNTKILELHTLKYAFWFLIGGLILSSAVFLIEVLITRLVIFVQYRNPGYGCESRISSNSESVTGSDGFESEIPILLSHRNNPEPKSENTDHPNSELVTESGLESGLPEIPIIYNLNPEP